jgi:hypothetical protein
MTPTEITAEMRRRGYTHVETSGGPVPLNSWRPALYSLTPTAAWNGHIFGANEVWEDADRTALWTFTRYEFTECAGCKLTFGFDALLGRPFYCHRCNPHEG